MKEGSASSTILATSLALNIALVAIIFWLGIHNSRILMKSYVEAARDRAQVQKGVLKLLEGADAERLDAVRLQLQLGIDVDERVAYKLETGEKPSPRSDTAE